MFWNLSPAGLWLHLKVKLLIKYIYLICIMNSCRICLGLKDTLPHPHLLPLPSSLTHWANLSFQPSVCGVWLCVHHLSKCKCNEVCVCECVAGEAGRWSTAVSGSVGRSLFYFAQQWFAIMDLFEKGEEKKSCILWYFYHSVLREKFWRFST